jgi:hypothetical protein
MAENDLYDFKDDEPVKPQRRPKTAAAKPLNYANVKQRGVDQPTAKKRTIATQSKEEWRRQTEVEAARQQWMQPTITLAVVAALFLTVGLIFGGPVGMAGAGVYFLILLVVNTFLGVIAGYAATLVGVGFGAPLLVCILQIAAAAMVGSFVYHVVPCGGIIGLMIYAAALAVAMQLIVELDGGESYAFALIFILLQLATLIGLAALLAGSFAAI